MARTGSYPSRITLGVRGAQVVLLATDEDNRDPQVLMEMNPAAARRIGLELIAGAAQLEEEDDDKD